MKYYTLCNLKIKPNSLSALNGPYNQLKMNLIRWDLNGTNELIKFQRGTYILSGSSLFGTIFIRWFWYHSILQMWTQRLLVLSLIFSCSLLKTTVIPLSTNNVTFFSSPGVEMLLSLTSLFSCPLCNMMSSPTSLMVALPSLSSVLCHSPTAELYFLLFWLLTGFSCFQSIYALISDITTGT